MINKLNLILTILCISYTHLTTSSYAAPSTETAKLPKIENRYKSLETFARGLFYLETMYVDPKKVVTDENLKTFSQTKSLRGPNRRKA